MNLLDVYILHDRGEITDDEAAEALQMSVKTWRFHLKRHGLRLPLVLAILDKVREDRITRSEAAEALGRTERQVNMLMQNFKAPRPLKEYLLLRERAQVKWEVRKRFAIDYIAGTMALDDAAEHAEVSDRQMRRWVKDLLDKHFGMVWGDLKELDATRRYKLASQIEELEKLELRKQRALNDIASGRKTLEEEALDRLLNKDDRRKQGKKLREE